jgi:hypothetical protein
MFFQIILILCFFIISCSSPSDDNPGQISTSDIYIGGSSRDSNNKNIPGYWKNGTWIGLENANNTVDTKYSAYVTSLVVDGDDIYAGGYCLNSAGIEKAGYWLNGSWHSLDNSYNTANRAAVNVIVVYGTDVYAGGYAYDSTVDIAGYWLNDTWHPLGDANPRLVSAMVVDETKIYAVGRAYIATSYFEGRYWENGDQTDLINTAPGKNCMGLALAVNGTDVYVGGYMMNSSDIVVAGYWLNNAWTPLANEYGAAYHASVKAMLVDGTDIYAGGYSRNSSGNNIPGYWRNGTWMSLSCYNGGEVISIAKTGGFVYCGGSTYDSSKTIACYWINGSRTDLANSIDSTKSSTVYAMVVVP